MRTMLMLAALGAALALEPLKLWADFGSASYLPGEKIGGNRPCPPPRGDLFCGLSDADAAFIAKTYSVISLEKCFGVRPSNTNDANHTMANFVTTAKQIMRLAPVGNKPQVLFYWSSNVAVAPCYEDAVGGAILQHQDWWLKNKTGGYIWDNVHSVGRRPWIDFTVPAAAAWWMSVPLRAQQLAQGSMAGVFVDSAGDWENVLLKRKLITAEKAAALNSAHRSAIRELHTQLTKAIGPQALVLGNALGPCLHPPCGPDGVDLLQEGIVDGVVAEHFGAFEWTDMSTGAVDANVVRQWLTLFDDAAAINGSVFVKTWPGPETTPIDSEGPSWPRKFLNPFTHKPLNRTNDGISKAAAMMLDYSLACFLCISRPGFMLSYGWWYDVSQGYLPGSDAPAEWYPQLSRGIGEATSPAIYTGRHVGENVTCTRNFEGAHMFVNFMDFGSAKIIFKEVS